MLFTTVVHTVVLLLYKYSELYCGSVLSLSQYHSVVRSYVQSTHQNISYHSAAPCILALDDMLGNDATAWSLYLINLARSPSCSVISSAYDEKAASLHDGVRSRGARTHASPFGMHAGCDAFIYVKALIAALWVLQHL